MNELDEDDEEESLLYNLVYCSRAVNPFASDDLVKLVASAQKHNAKESITGWLVYSHGIFFQWLEGPRRNVERLMDSISADPRHNTIVVLTRSEELRGRVFSSWDMELVSAEDIRLVLFDAAEVSSDPDLASAMQSLIRELDSKALGVAD